MTKRKPIPAVVLAVALTLTLAHSAVLTPGYPQDVNISRAANTITWEWESPEDSGASAITHYTVRWAEDGSERWQFATVPGGATARRYSRAVLNITPHRATVCAYNNSGGQCARTQTH